MESERNSPILFSKGLFRIYFLLMNYIIFTIFIYHTLLQTNVKGGMKFLLFFLCFNN